MSVYSLLCLLLHIGLLAMVSPVWRTMLTGNFKEKDAGEIPLPGKRFDEVQELLLCISPATQNTVDGNIVLAECIDVCS